MCVHRIPNSRRFAGNWKSWLLYRKPSRRIHRCGRGKIFYWKLENIADAKTDQRFRFHGSLSLVIFCIHNSFLRILEKICFLFFIFFLLLFLVTPLLSFGFLSFSYAFLSCFILDCVNRLSLKY